MSSNECGEKYYVKDGEIFSDEGQITPYLACDLLNTYNDLVNGYQSNKELATSACKSLADITAKYIETAKEVADLLRKI